MPYSFLDSTERAITVRLGSEEIVLRSLSIFDLIPWLEDETQVWREVEIAKIPADAKDKQDRINYANAFELNPPALQPTMFKPAGAIKATKRLFVKAGKTEADAEQWLTTANPSEVIILAVTLSGLFTRQEVDQIFGGSKSTDKPDPNGGTDQPS